MQAFCDTRSDCHMEKTGYGAFKFNFELKQHIIQN